MLHSRAAAALVAAAAAAVVLLALPAAARVMPLGPVTGIDEVEPCFSCIDTPICGAPEPLKGTLYSLTKTGKPDSPKHPVLVVPGSGGRRLAYQTQSFNLRHRQRTWVEVGGRRLELGSFAPELSTDFVHVFVNGSMVPGSNPPLRYQSVVEFRCKHGASQEQLVKVVLAAPLTEGPTATARRLQQTGNAATAQQQQQQQQLTLVQQQQEQPAAAQAATQQQQEQPAGAATQADTQQQQQQQAPSSFLYIVQTSRACDDLPPCAASLDLPPADDYVIYKPPLQRQNCPGTFLSAHVCSTQDAGLDLRPNGPLLTRQRWSVLPAGGAGAGGDELVGVPVVIQNAARSGRGCASYLGPGPSRACTPGPGAPAMSSTPEQWVLEAGPAGPASRLVHQYRIKSKAMVEAGCQRSYLCLREACGGGGNSSLPTSPGLGLCALNEPGYLTQWLIRPSSLDAVL